ncbi:hypothetical protein ACFLYK_01035 [Candidatus Cloacimonadota bacterium]
MRYLEFKEAIKTELSEHPEGFTWNELKERLGLSYKTNCPNWTKRLEDEIGLVRVKTGNRALVWKLL